MGLVTDSESCLCSTTHILYIMIQRQEKRINSYESLQSDSTHYYNGSCGDNWFADLRSFSGSVRPIDKAAVDFDRADSEGYQRLMD